MEIAGRNFCATSAYVAEFSTDLLSGLILKYELQNDHFQWDLCNFSEKASHVSGPGSTLT